MKFIGAAKNISKIPTFTKEDFIKDMTEVLRSYKQIARNARMGKNRGIRQRIEEEQRHNFPDNNN